MSIKTLFLKQYVELYELVRESVYQFILEKTIILHKKDTNYY